jgi:hypothetical protein
MVVAWDGRGAGGRSASEPEFVRTSRIMLRHRAASKDRTVPSLLCLTTAAAILGIFPQNHR